MDELYEEFLIDETGAEKDLDGYSGLCRILHRIPFLPVVEMDWNRNDEALDLSLEWAEGIYRTDEDALDAAMRISEAHPNGFCTMLELLVILARRIRYELMDSQYEDVIGRWTTELIHNCGLGGYTNEAVEDDPEEAEREICEIMGNVIFRQYGWDGEGGFFPLKHPTKDQRDEELLTQMNYYISENYDLC